MSVLTVLAVSLVLVVVNGVFVAAEFALIAAPRLSLKRRAASGDRSAGRILNTLTSPVKQDRYVATAQLGITIASLGLGMYGEHTLAGLLEPLFGAVPLVSSAALAAAIALGALTLAHIVLGEMVPKGVALQHPERVARLAAWPMRITGFVLYPLVAISNGVSNLSLRLIGIRREAKQHDRAYTPEELQFIVEESERGGALAGPSGRILHELLEFGDLNAGQAMVPRVRVVGLPVGASPDDIRQILSTHRHTRYPVYDGDLDQVVGMLHSKDLLRRLLLDEHVDAAEVRPLPVVPETATLDTVLATMQRAQAHMAVVIDEHGGTEGIISLEDLFEEVVGEIDEGVPAAVPLRPDADGSVVAAGTLRLDELGRHFDLDFGHEEVDSVSGLVLTELGRPPRVGDVVRHGRIELTVLAILGRGVKTARARLLSDETAPEGPV
jgi:CBS domain containing-hemolysin-like protein